MLSELKEILDKAEPNITDNNTNPIRQLFDIYQEEVSEYTKTITDYTENLARHQAAQKK